MSQRYPCPNPVCKHEFEAAQLVGVAVVTCPQCGMVIQLQAQPAAVPMASPVRAVPPGGVPMARPVTGVPMARPVTTQPPIARAVPTAAPPAGAVSRLQTVSAAQAASPLPTIASQPAANPPTVIVRAKNLPKSRDWLTYSLVIGGFLLLASLAVVGAMVGVGSGAGGSLFGGGSAFRSSDFNYTLQKRSGWEEDKALREKFGVSQFAQQRVEPAGFMAMEAVDYKDRMPTARELESEARKLLGTYFKKNLEVDKDIEETELAGHKANQFKFHGENDDMSADGEVVFFADQGIGFWLYTWAPASEAKAVASEFESLRQGFALQGKREKWDQTQSRQITLTGAKTTGYQLVDSTGRWEKIEDAESFDPAADLVLFAPDPQNRSMKSQGANVIVLKLEGGKDALEAAKAHVLAMHKRVYPTTRITDAYADGDGPKARVGDAKGHLVKWRISNGDGRERYAVVGVVPRSNDVLVIYAESPWEPRHKWEDLFVKIVESVQLKE